MKRSKAITTNLVEGKYDHVDLAYYTLQLNARLLHHRGVMKRIELRDCLERVRIMWPRSEEAPHPLIALETLPAELADMAQGVYKVEWFYEGALEIKTCEVYRFRYFYQLYGERNILKKTIDTVGMCHYEMPFKMWLESVRCPGQLITYEGMAWWNNMKALKRQKLLMKTIVFDYEHLITVTQVIAV